MPFPAFVCICFIKDYKKKKKVKAKVWVVEKGAVKDLTKYHLRKKIHEAKKTLKYTKAHFEGLILKNMESLLEIIFPIQIES